jgi:hypothetical protein
VLAVHGHQIAASAPTSFGDERPAHHERLLVRQRDALPGVQRRQRCVEPRGADDRVQHDVDVAAHRGLDETLRARAPFAVRSRLVVVPVLNDADIRRMEAIDLLTQQRGVRVRCERGNTEPVLVPLEDAKRRRADGPGRAEDRDAARHRGAGMSSQSAST